MSHHLEKREKENLRKLLAMARDEDLGNGDVTSRLLPEETMAEARFVARQELIVCGVSILETIASAYDGQIKTRLLRQEGDTAATGEVIAEWSGPARGVLSAERVALNFMQRLSAVATAASQYVRAVAGTGAKIYDTRKTTPGWRDLEKFAVRVGGGCNHRRGLYDAALIKDNHLAILARSHGRNSIEALADELERLRPAMDDLAFIELEVDTLEQYSAALKLPVDIILLDNMTVDQLTAAVEMRNEAELKGKIELEASGGVTLKTVRKIAETGVERISVGAITHSAPAVDIALDIDLI